MGGWHLEISRGTLPAMKLHEALEAMRDEVMARWQAQVRGAIVPEAISRAELEDQQRGPRSPRQDAPWSAAASCEFQTSESWAANG